MTNNIRVIIAADLVPTENTCLSFENGDLEKLLGKELLEVWKDSDIRLFNLECPLTYETILSDKNGPHLKSNPSVIKGIKELNPSVVCLANNHIMDYKTNGLYDTMDILEKSNIKYIGVGENREYAREPHIIVKENITIGLYNCAENEFGVAQSKTAGMNAYDSIQTLEDIQRLSNRVDYTVVIYHGGKEHYRYPSPNLQARLRKMIDYGADIVVAQHSHCIGSYEIYKDRYVIYGQGNFIFNYEDKIDDEYWNNGMLIDIRISLKNKKYTANFIPYLMTKDGIRIANNDVKSRLLEDLNKRSLETKDDEYIKEKFKEYSHENIINYLVSISGQSKTVSRIDRIFFKRHFLKRKFSKKRLLKIQNFIECEAHQELLIEGVKYLIDKSKTK